MWPWKKARERSSERNASKNSSRAMVTDMGKRPPVSPLARQRMSGDTPSPWHANRCPVRPKPVMTSSAISGMPRLAVTCRRAPTKPMGWMRMPAAPMSRGSRITPAARSPSSSSARTAAAVSIGIRRTSNSMRLKGSKKGSGSPTAMAPKVSPW